MTAPIYDVFLLDSGGLRSGQIEHTRLEVAQRYLRLGRWELTVPELPALAFLTWKSRIQVVRNDEVVFTGPVTHVSRKWTYGATNARQIIGTCDNVHIADYLAYPDPALSGPPFNTQAYDVREGIASHIIWQYLHYNMGEGAVPSRKVEVISTPEPALFGANVFGRARFQNLLDICQELAITGGVGFEFVGKTLRMYEPQDRSSTIVFSQELDNLKEYEYDAHAPESNAVMVGGGGEGVDRVFLAKEDYASIIGSRRKEVFVDARHTSDTQELDQKATEELEKKAHGDINVHVIPGAQAVENMKPYDDYYLGDLVSAIIDGEEIVAQVQEIGILVTEDDVHEHASLGNFGKSSRGITIMDLMRGMNARTRNLEVR